MHDRRSASLDAGTGIAWHRRCTGGEAGCHMDLLLVAATILFFAVSLAYARGCDRL